MWPWLIQKAPWLPGAVAAGWTLLQAIAVTFLLSTFVFDLSFLGILAENLGLTVSVFVVAVGVWRHKRKLDDLHVYFRRLRLPVIVSYSEPQANSVLEERLRARRTDIRRVRSTAIQGNQAALTSYMQYFPTLYDIFADNASGVTLDNVLRVPRNLTEEDRAEVQRYCFAPLANPPLSTKFLGATVCFAITTYLPELPFINFTLIDYKDGAREVFWGWYVMQASDVFEGFRDHEVFGSTTHEDIVALFESVYSLMHEQIVSSGSGCVIHMTPTTALESVDELLKSL